MARPPARRRPRALRACAVSLVVIVGVLAPVLALGQSDAELGLALDVRGSPIRSDGSGPGVVARVRLDAPARLRVVVTDFDGRAVRELFEGDRPPGLLVRSWRGRDADGDLVPPGPYRIVATARATSDESTTPPHSPDRSAPATPSPRADGARAQAWVTVASRPVYPQAPGSITVAVDPGHGGSLHGAVADDGTREADLNLDIGLRLARMLEGAGVDVVLTRSTDTDVNTPAIDRTGDGIVDETDELAARPDLANAARADLFIAVHNNIAVNRTTGGPSTYYYDQRTFGDRSRRLARIIQARMVEALEAFGGGGWRPYDHGALIYPYYVLRDYDPPRLLRPTQMPGVLSEGMFLSNPRELRLLKQRRVRQAMAVAYYEAVAQYLARRGHHVGYAVESVPAEVPVGVPLELRVEVRNQGSEPMRGWRLTAGALRAGSAAVGRARPGTRLGQRRIPPLAPGESAWLTFRMRAPKDGGSWVIMVDAMDRAGRRASRLGSPMLQVPLTTTEPLPSTEPRPSTPPLPSTAPPTQSSPSPVPTAGPSSAEPSAAPPR